MEENKYAIYAYTHGPVTGSGFLLVSISVHEQSVNHDQMNVSSHYGSLLVELRVLIPPPSSLPYSANVNLTAAYRRWPWEKQTISYNLNFH